MQNQYQRVVITGMGVITPIGNTVEEFWHSALNGISGIKNFADLDTTNYPCKVAGEVKNFDPTMYMDKKSARRMARFSQFAVAAAQQSIQNATLNIEDIDNTRTGIICGNGGGGYPLVEKANRTLFEKNGMRIDPLYVAKWLPNMAAANVSIQLGILGYTNTVVTACASGTQAIGDAAEIIRHNKADVMIAGGTEAGICELGLAGFATMRALSTSYNDNPTAASRPFDKNRDGFVPAEGAGMIVLESLDHALSRGAKPLAELIGYGVSADASYLVAPSDGGEGAARAMSSALLSADKTVNDIDYISAHATATNAGDIAETEAIKTVFKDLAKEIPISALKSQTGHMLGGSGATETVAAIQTILTNQITPTLNLETPDPRCDLDYVPLISRSANIKTVLKNSFGFGGQNAVLIIQKYEETK